MRCRFKHKIFQNEENGYTMAIPGVGGAKADKIMHDAHIPDNRRLGGLGIRQAEALFEYLS